MPAVLSSAGPKLCSCLSQQVPPLERLLPNIWFHISKGWLLCLLVKKEDGWETGWVINKYNKYIHSWHATINSQFICVLFLSNIIPLHVRDDLGTFSWGMGQMRGKNCGLWDVVMAKSPESRYLPTRQFLIKKAVRSDVWECCVMKFGWIEWARAMKNWWIHGDCSNVHGCPWLFPMPLDVLFGDILTYP